MKNNLLLLVSIVLLLSLAIAGAHAQKPVSYTPVPLVVSIDAADTAGNPCKICSDGRGNYVDGTAGVSANFDNSGNLIINFQTGSVAYRKVSFNYDSPLSAQNHIPVNANYGSSAVHTLPINGASYTPLQNMANGASQCIQLGWSYTLADKKKTQWRHNFHRELLSFDLSQTAYAVVTRLDANNWEVEPKAASCNPANAAVAKVFDTPTQGPFNFTDDGLYYLPFKLTLTRK